MPECSPEAVLPSAGNEVERECEFVEVHCEEGKDDAMTLSFGLCDRPPHVWVVVQPRTWYSPGTVVAACELFNGTTSVGEHGHRDHQTSWAPFGGCRR